MIDLFHILFPPLVACLVLAGIHCYLGLHVLMREVIFVDLALAQVASLGVAVGAIAGVAPHSPGNHVFALVLTLGGAAVFALARWRDRRIAQEAVIGIVYAVCTAVTIMILSHSAVERDEIEHMLVGRLLFVDWTEIGITATIYSGVAGVHLLCRRPMFAISRGESVPHARKWDFVFYATFGIVVSSSVQIAGVLLVFSLLVVPAACATLFWNSVRHRLLGGWLFGAVGSVAGIIVSAEFDFPTGASVVASLGALFAICSMIAAARPRP